MWRFRVWGSGLRVATFQRSGRYSVGQGDVDAAADDDDGR